MLRSIERILTTHTGSLPRPDNLIQLMFAKEEGTAVDSESLAQLINSTVKQIVTKQMRVGIDIINDGEVSKPSYATYIKDRLNGFGGKSQPLTYQDLAEFPRVAQKVFSDPGRARRKTPGCNSDISIKDANAISIDIANLQEAVAENSPSSIFLNAASPGVISLFFSNTHYSNFEEYIFAIAESMKYEYQSITGAGIALQIDCPDLAMGRHIQYSDLELGEFRKRAEIHVEALNYAIQDIDPNLVRLHLCWGNYEGPHHCDVPLADIIDISFKAKVSGISFEAANPRHAHEYEIFDNIKLPDSLVLIPGVVESKSNFIEHPQLIAQRISRFAKRVGRENIIVGTDCGFGTWVGQAAVDPDIVWAKLAAMVEGANIASKELWK